MDDEHEDQGPPSACTTCLTIPARIVEISSDQPNSAIVDVMGVRRRVDMALLQDDPPRPDEWVLIHVGFALSKISEQDALGQMETLRRLGGSEAALREFRGLGQAADGKSG